MWCITGSLSFLPIHAAGEYDKPETVLPNLVVSSYIPTLTSLGLFTSTNTQLPIPERGLSALPGTIDEINEVKLRLVGLKTTTLNEQEALADTVLAAMIDHSWVHFACHASQNPLDPLKSAFHLHDKDLDLAT